MKLLVEFDLDDSWDAYIPDNNEKLKHLINFNYSDVKTRIVEDDTNKIKCDLLNDILSQMESTHCEYHTEIVKDELDNYQTK